MIYLISILCGVINGLFASAAGQVMLFYLVFILKLESHKARATSIFCISIVTVISIVRYLKFVKFKIYQVIIILICGSIFGFMGSKVMKKLNSNKLNLVSGIIMTGISIYKLFIK